MTDSPHEMSLADERMGEILGQIYERQLDGEITTLEEGLDWAKRLTG